MVQNTRGRKDRTVTEGGSIQGRISGARQSAGSVETLQAGYTSNLSHRVIAIIVSYNPNIDDFIRLLDALLPQVAYAIVVDNCSLFDLSLIMARLSGQNVELLKMSENVGIAAAQNAGIERAMKLGADFVLLSDQDSVPSSSMVSELLSAMMSANADLAEPPVAAVGPVTIDSRSGQVSFFVIESYGIPRKWNLPTDIQKIPSTVEVMFLIASGTLIPTEVIKRIGGMRSNYFIDHVDTEWCFRAQAEGYRLLGVPSSRLEHKLGDAVKRIWFFGPRQVMYHTPLRDYYMFRNTIQMLRDTCMSMIWRVYFVFRLVRFAGYFLVFSADRYLRIQRMFTGLLHAHRRVSGRLDTKTNQCCAVPVLDIESKIRTHDDK